MYGTEGDWGKTWGGIITSVINSVQIQILNTVYKKVAVALTGEFSLFVVCLFSKARFRNSLFPSPVPVPLHRG